MTTLESEMFADGFVRCPNVPERWYPGHAGKLQPVFPMELRVTDKIWLVASSYGDHSGKPWPLMGFESVKELNSYLIRNGKKSEALPAFANAQD